MARKSNLSYMDSPRETRDGSVVVAKRGEPAVVYPASDVGSEWPVPTWNLRTERQSLRAAGVKLP